MKAVYLLVGMRHRGAEAVDLVRKAPIGEPLTLVREPGNQFDGSAIQVWMRGMHVGFLRAEKHQADLAKRMDARIAMDSAATFAAVLRPGSTGSPWVEVDE